MLLKNASARLIVINGEMVNGGYKERYQILCGDNPAVDVPDKICGSFVQDLIDSGELICLDEKKKSKKE